MKYLWGIAFGIICGILGVGLLLLAVRPPRGEAVQLSPPPTEAPMIVHITGAVVEPGVYTQSPGSRVMDAIQAAGGLTGEADTTLINLAKLVEDGMQIWVPSQIEGDFNPENPEHPEMDPHSVIEAGQININTANQGELETLSGIGPVIAKAIIQYRQEHGPFDEIEAIQAVSGIGPATFEKIKDFITLGGVAED
jgi:competence protein ComEA